MAFIFPIHSDNYFFLTGRLTWEDCWVNDVAYLHNEAQAGRKRQ